MLVSCLVCDSSVHVDARAAVIVNDVVCSEAAFTTGCELYHIAGSCALFLLTWTSCSVCPALNLRMSFFKCTTSRSSSTYIQHQLQTGIESWKGSIWSLSGETTFPMLLSRYSEYVEKTPLGVHRSHIGR